ncbi:hypothetical protein [Wenjunlia tyrosinilytica]|uniref:Uncharacterized protein n=1 Tax=Wenjunlia tyrosinilytica TaxID=1544741 RepID=A0A917ZXD9_9ACTN|nr:hypothetical protein [Wenjunlia tyrosinilytica]GGO99368.1 hypothetical protein GCM10012280_65660 [Wenjunlia tyrosinilytica]
MSDTTTDRTPTLRPVPSPEPPAELTGSPAAIYTELRSLTEPATVTELALAAGTGRSTAGKALTTLEQRGLAVRIPGGHDGPRRTPDRWHAAAPTHETSRPENPSDGEPSGSHSEPPVSADQEGARAPQAPDGDNTDAAGARTAEEEQDCGLEDGAEDPAENDSGGSQNLPVPQSGAGRQTSQTEAIIPPGERKRLAPGGLRHLVIEHLQAHPGEAFTATRISRVIEKSSGAIANALVTLTRQGTTEQVTDKPRTYRLTASEVKG